MPGLAIVYARISGQNDERTASLDSQVQGGLERAASLGLTVLPEDVHRERFTGAVLDRPELNAARAKVRSGRYAALVVWCLDRLSRGGQWDMGILFDECVRHKVEVVSVTEDIDKTPEGILIGSIKAYVGQVERAKIRERTVRGRDALLNRGRLPRSGYALYGYTYDAETGGRAVDPAAAAVVRELFVWVASGVTAREAARRLNARKAPTPRERLGHRFKDGRSPRWGDAAIGRMIRDESYLGVTSYGKTRCVGERRLGRPVQEPVPRDGWRAMPEGLTPPLVDRETFDAANARLDDRKDAVVRGRNSIRPRLLRGRISCGVCGLLMNPVTNKFRGKHYLYYACASRDPRRAGGRCGAKMVPAEEADGFVWGEVVRRIRDKDAVLADARAAVAALDEHPANRDAEAVLAGVRRLEEVQGTLREKWAAALRDGESAFADLCEDQLRRTAADLTSGREALAAARARAAEFADRASMLVRIDELVDRACRDARDDMTFDDRRKYLELLDVRVVADGRDLHVTLSVLPPRCHWVTSHDDTWSAALRIAV